MIQNPRHVAKHNAFKVEVLYVIICAGVMAVETVDRQVMSMMKIDLWFDQSSLVAVPEQEQCIDVLPPAGEKLRLCSVAQGSL